MRRAARVDKGQAAIVEALRAAGVSVRSTAAIGAGFPDLVAARKPDVWLIEVKGPKGELTPDQEKFIAEWRGVVHIVRGVDDALRLVGVAKVRDL